MEWKQFIEEMNVKTFLKFIVALYIKSYEESGERENYK